MEILRLMAHCLHDTVELASVSIEVTLAVWWVVTLGDVQRVLCLHAINPDHNGHGFNQ